MAPPLDRERQLQQSEAPQQREATRFVVETSRTEQDRTRREVQTTRRVRRQVATLEEKVLLNDVMSYDDFIRAVEQLSYQFQDFKNDGSRRNRNQGKTIFRRGEPLNKAWREGLRRVRSVADQWLDQLNAMKLQVTRAHQRDLRSRAVVSNVAISNDLVNKLRRAQGELANLTHDRDNARGGEFSQRAHFPSNSPERVREAATQQERDLRFQNELSDALQESAILALFNNNKAQANAYLQAAIDGKWDIQQALFYKQNADIFAHVFSQRVAGSPKYFMLANRCASEANRLTGTGSRSSAQAWNSYENRDYGETFEQEGVQGVVRKFFDGFSNMSPSQKNWWTQGVMLAGAIWGLYLLGKAIFGKKENIVRNLFITAGSLIGLNFASQATTGESFFSLFGKAMKGWLSLDKLKDQSSRSLEGFSRNNPEMYRMAAYPTLANSVFGHMTVGELHGMTQDPAKWRAMYDRNSRELSSPYSADFRQFVGPEYKEAEFQVWMNAIGVKLKDPSQQQMKVSEICAKNAENVVGFSEYLDSQGVTVVAGKGDEVRSYLAAHGMKPATIEYMKEKWRLREDDGKQGTDRPQDLQAKAGFDKDVDALDLDSSKKENLRVGMKSYYDSMSIRNKPSFSLKQEGSEVFMHIGNRKIKVDLKNKILPWFKVQGQPKVFSTYAGLLHTAYLTDKLLHVKQGHEAKSGRPFEYRSRWKGIYFDNSDFFEWNKDTRMLSTGPWGWAKDVSVEIGENPADYATYLNDLWEAQIRVGTTNVATSAVSLESLEDKGGTRSQVGALSLRAEEKLEMQELLNKFWTDDPRRASLSISETAFSSYGQTVEINLAGRSIKGLSTPEWRTIPFASVTELLSVAHFLNLAKWMTKDLKPYATKPFYLDAVRRFCFKDKDGKETTLTEFSTREVLSPSSITQNREYIVNYLNAWKSTPSQ